MARIEQVTVTTAGAEVQADAPHLSRGSGYYSFMAHPSNAGTIWVADGDGKEDAANNGYPLLADGPPLVIFLTTLEEVWFDASIDAQTVCWAKLTV